MSFVEEEIRKERIKRGALAIVFVFWLIFAVALGFLVWEAT